MDKPPAELYLREASVSEVASVVRASLHPYVATAPLPGHGQVDSRHQNRFVLGNLATQGGGSVDQVGYVLNDAHLRGMSNMTTGLRNDQILSQWARSLPVNLTSNGCETAGMLLCRLLGCDPQTITQLETGQAHPTLAALTRKVTVGDSTGVVDALLQAWSATVEP